MYMYQISVVSMGKPTNRTQGAWHHLPRLPGPRHSSTATLSSQRCSAPAMARRQRRVSSSCAERSRPSEVRRLSMVASILKR